jgi:c-di-GMP-binding flagellar brake protein YcgR
MKIEELGLAVGDAMQLQIGDSAENRYPVRYYGSNPRGSVIISAPSSGVDKMIFVREGQLVTLRFVAKNVASGFTTRVMTTRGQPYPYLHLEIPKEIQTVEVRKEVRVACETPLTVLNKTHQSPALTATMLNMSCSGGRFETGMKLALKGNILNITMKLEIEKEEHLVTFDSLVTYVKEVDEDEEEGEEAVYTYGVNIESIDKEDMLIMRAFIYQELLRNLHMI